MLPLRTLVPPLDVQQQRVFASQASAGLNGTSVFWNGLAGVNNYRIPAIVQASGGRLVAFAEARHGGDFSAGVIATRTSDDGGDTWSPVAFAAGHIDTPAARRECLASLESCRAGNPAAVFDAVTGKILLFYIIRGYGHGEDGVGNGMVSSDDGGLTWSRQVDLSDLWGAASGSMPGPGTALQLQGGPHDGRLLVASHHGHYVTDYVTYSDDHGETWTVSNTTFDGMDEAQLTQLPNRSLLIIMRSKEGAENGHAMALSDDHGETFGPISYDPRLVTPVVQASIVSFGGATYFSNPASRFSRRNLRIRRSRDSTRSWNERSLLVDRGPFGWTGYSCLVKGILAKRRGADVSQRGDEGGILFETQDGTIKFARWPLAYFDSDADDDDDDDDDDDGDNRKEARARIK